MDALRFVAIFPFGKAAKTLESVRGVARAKVIADVKGPRCFWVALAKALTHTGHRFKGKLFVSVEDLARAVNIPMSQLREIPNLYRGMTYLQMIMYAKSVGHDIPRLTIPVLGVIATEDEQ